jgi:hypothetical protein
LLAKVHSCAIVGLEGAIVEEEVDSSRGLPSFTIVGLPDTAVQESRERVQAAIKNAGLIFPRQRLTVNLAPAAIVRSTSFRSGSLWQADLRPAKYCPWAEFAVRSPSLPEILGQSLLRAAGSLMALTARRPIGPARTQPKAERYGFCKGILPQTPARRTDDR